MGFAVIEINDRGASGATFTKSRQLERGTLFQISLRLEKILNFETACNAELFLSEGDTNSASACLLFFEGGLYDNSPFIWQGSYEIEGWESIVLTTFGSGGYIARCLANIRYKPI